MISRAKATVLAFCLMVSGIPAQLIDWPLGHPTAIEAAVAAEAYQVHVGYVIPLNRTAQPDAVADLQALVQTLQDWFQEQMDRNGMGRMTFQFETDEDGISPKVHTINSQVTDEFLRESLWGHTMDAVNGAGFSLWSPGDVWLLVPEAHLQQPDGTIIGGFAGGAYVPDRGGAGVAVIGSDMLPRATWDALTDERSYDGLIIPEIGPYPLAQDLSFPWFEGTTISSVSSSAQGAIAHELEHAFGLFHDFRNDDNFHGNLMGNGLRGFRGSLLPEQFPNDDTWLSYEESLALSASRFFNSTVDFEEDVRPRITVQTRGEVDPVEGRLQIHFMASDTSGLTAALLRADSAGGNVVAEIPLDGTSVDTIIETPFYDPGNTETYTLVVYDTQGNRSERTQTISTPAGLNQAPQPFIKMSASRVKVGEDLRLDASRSTDDDGLTRVMVEWDLNGDGIFDTVASRRKTLVTQFGEPGTRRIIARLTDVDGGYAVSAPLSMRVVLPGDFDDNGILDVADIDDLTIQVRSNEHLHAYDLDGDRLVNQSDRSIWIEDLKRTYFGDANLDGEFNSNDFIQVFATGEYEDLESGNSTWSEGDWTGDGEFASSDFLLAFQRGGYEQGPRTDAAAVPEPGGWLLWLIAAGWLLMTRCFIPS